MSLYYLLSSANSFVRVIPDFRFHSDMILHQTRKPGTSGPQHKLELPSGYSSKCFPEYPVPWIVDVSRLPQVIVYLGTSERRTVPAFPVLISQIACSGTR